MKGPYSLSRVLESIIHKAKVEKMNRQFTFENQNFQPDYIAFKFQRLDLFEEKQILDYLFKVGFNIYSELPPKHHSVRNHSKNRFQIYITKDIAFWQGSVIHFTG